MDRLAFQKAYVFSKVFIVVFLGCSAALEAQAVTPAFQSTAKTQMTPLVRGEGLAEFIGDILLTCTGGTPTPAGQALPMLNIGVVFNTNATSALLANPLSEALLLIDEPAPSAQGACTGFLVPGDTIPRRQITGTGTGVVVYNGAPDRPSIFQGARWDGPNQLVFMGVPLDPPGANGTRTLRITNVRADANLLGAGTGLSPAPASIKSFI